MMDAPQSPRRGRNSSLAASTRGSSRPTRRRRPHNSGRSMSRMTSRIRPRCSFQSADQYEEDDGQNLFDSIPQIIWLMDAQGHLEAFNHAWDVYTGVSLAQCLDSDAKICVHPDDVERVEKAWTESLATGAPLSVEVRLRRYDGQFRWHISRGNSIRDHNDVVTNWVGTCMDFHEMREYSDLVNNMQQELRDERKLLQTVIAQSPVAIVASRADTGKIFLSNDKMNQIWQQNINADTFGDYNWEGFKYDGKKYQPDEWPLARSCMRGEVILREDVICQVVADDCRSILSINSAPIYDDQRTIIGAVSTQEDVTQLRMLEHDKVLLLGQKQAAVESARAKGEFIANISHEIRTPLNGIVGMAQLLSDSELTTSQVCMVETITSCSKILLGVVSDLLDFSKVEAGKVVLEYTPFNLREAFETVLSILRPLAALRNNQLQFYFRESCPVEVVGDLSRLKQIVMNLLANAIKFCKNGKVQLDVLARIGSTNEDPITLFINVTDTGIGMREETRSRLFQPFVQADTSTTRQYGGTGLGLSICNSLVNLMEGSITVESELGVSSCFRVEVKVMPHSSMVLDSIQEARPFVQLDDAQVVNRARVLVAEDNMINQTIFKKVLKKFAVQSVTVCNNGLEAVEAYKTDSLGFNICFMDIHMPVMDGRDATRAIRAFEQVHSLRRLPIVAVTASTMQDDVDACYECGMDDHIAKPFSQDRVFSSIRNQILTADPQPKH